jgi:hypothetical protein
MTGGLKTNPGDFLLSHRVSPAVPSALRGLTSLFGMGRGGSPSLWSPETLKAHSVRAYPQNCIVTE